MIDERLPFKIERIPGLRRTVHTVNNWLAPTIGTAVIEPAEIEPAENQWKTSCTESEEERERCRTKASHIEFTDMDPTAATIFVVM